MQDAEEFCIDDEEDEEEKKTRPIIKNAMDLQRLKLEKLMKNPDKPIVIPEPPREKDFMQTVPTFVRNVMGSSAGAGSGEFHVYRHLRRKEYARQKYIQAKSIREQLDDEYRQKIEQNRLSAEAKTAKRRAKRLKKKQKQKEKGKRPRKETDNDKQHEDDTTESSEAESCDENPTENKSPQPEDTPTAREGVCSAERNEDKKELQGNDQSKDKEIQQIGTEPSSQEQKANDEDNPPQEASQNTEADLPPAVQQLDKNETPT